jgi:hypothetical protein
VDNEVIPLIPIEEDKDEEEHQAAAEEPVKKLSQFPPVVVIENFCLITRSNRLCSITFFSISC